MNDTELAAQMVAALVDESTGLLGEGADLLADALLGRKVRDVIDVDGIAAVISNALRSDMAQHITDIHILPSLDRHRARVDAHGEVVGDLLPLAAKEKLRGLVEETAIEQPEWIRDAIDKALVRKLVAPVFQMTLLSFARKLPIPSLGGGAGGGIAKKLMQSVGERAEKLADAGRKAMGGLSAEVDKRFQAAAKDAAETTSNEFREALDARMRSDEGQEILAEIRRKAFDHVMTIPVGAVMRDFDVLPRNEVQPLVGAVLAHNARRPVGKSALEQELQAIIDAEGDRSIREVLDLGGVGEGGRALVATEAGAILRALLQGEEGKAWVAKVIATARTQVP
ncbi:MAG: hypothetical protein AAGF12_05325 [Myxococcota bacterium]